MSPMPPRPPRPDQPDPSGIPPRPELPGSSGRPPGFGQPEPELNRPQRPEAEQPDFLVEDDWKAQTKIIVGSWLGKRRKELPSWKSFHPQDILWWVRSWWRRSSRGGRAFGLLIAFLCIGAMLRITGCGAAETTPPDVVLRSGNNPAIEKAIQSATSYVESASNVQSNNQAMNLTVTYQKESNSMIVQNSGGLLAVDAAGKSWAKQRGCWSKSADGSQRPEALTVVLPLQEDSVRFKDIKTSGSTQTLSFQASQLGSWGVGSGKLQLQDGHPTQFTYQSDEDGAEAQFILTYPSKGPIKNLQPKC